MRKVILVFILCLFGAAATFAQSGRQKRPLYTFGNQFNTGGWHFAPGATFMLPAQSNRLETRLINTGEQIDTLFAGNFDAAGRLGFYLEFGKQRFFEQPLFVHYIDYGIHFKQLRGSEEFVGLVQNEGAPLLTSNRGTFGNGFLGVYFNANHIVQTTDKSFVQLSLGLNAEYRVLSRRTFEGVASNLGQEFADPFQGQVHAKLGFGFRPEAGILIIPTLETPILNISPFYDGKSTLPFFNSRYRPIILTVRILFLGKNKAADCVGAGTEKRGHQLWDPEMARKSKKKTKKKPSRR
jgi:hypothetical protein